MLIKRQLERQDLPLEKGLDESTTTVQSHLPVIFQQYRSFLLNSDATYNAWRMPFYPALLECQDYDRPLSASDHRVLHHELVRALDKVELRLDNSVTSQGNKSDCWAWIEDGSHKIIRIRSENGLHTIFEQLYSSYASATADHERHVIAREFSNVEAFTIVTLMRELALSAIKSWHPRRLNEDEQTGTQIFASLSHTGQGINLEEIGEHAETQFVGMVANLFPIDGRRNVLGRVVQETWRAWEEDDASAFVQEFWADIPRRLPLIRTDKLSEQVYTFTGTSSPVRAEASVLGNRKGNEHALDHRDLSNVQGEEEAVELEPITIVLGPNDLTSSSQDVY